MPTTTQIETILNLRAIGARTDFASVAVDDLSAEELRYDLIVWSGGTLQPAAAYQAAKGAAATMNVVVGSGAAKVDYAIVPGSVAGQGNYLVRLDEVTKTITLAAADPSNPRIDEIYVVVMDDAYDASGKSLPILAVRRGDAAATPSAPGPDAGWDAYLLLATVDVPAGAADIVVCTLTDERVSAALTVPRLSATEGTFNGVDVADHDHSGGSLGADVDANDLLNLKSAVDAADVDADTVDGLHAAAFALLAHVHSGADITSGTVAFARLPTGTGSSQVAIGNHAHSGVYANASHNHSGADITSGTVAFARLPTGTGSTHVAVGNHVHATMLADAGTQAAPSVALGAAGTGFNREVATQIRWGISGTFGGFLFAGGIGLPDASVPTDPAMAFANDLDTGIYRPTANMLAISAGGVAIATFANGSIVLPAAGTTADNQLPGWRQLSTPDRSINALVSGRKYKENIEDADLEVAYTAVTGLRVRQFNSIPDDGKFISFGVIADEAAVAAPYLVTYDEAGEADAFGYEGMIMPLVYVVQDLITKIEELESRLAE